jgi:hypothetical protein
MTHLRRGILLFAAVLLLTAVSMPAQEATWPERQAERVERRTEQLGAQAEKLGEQAEERAERLRERAERLGERVERLGDRAAERVERIQDRIERRIERVDDRGARILIARNYRLPEGLTAQETVVVFGGDATVDGHAEDDIVVIGGRLRLGPKAVVDGDVSVVGGTLDRDPAARIQGDVNVARVRWPDWNWAGWVGPFELPPFDRFWWQGAALAFTIGRFVVVLFLSILLVSLAPRWTTAMATRLAGGPGGPLLAGIGAEILFTPAVILLSVVLIITIVGIPLLAAMPLLIAAFGLLWVSGYATVAGLVGARLRGTDWYTRGLGAADVIIGSCILSGLTLFGQVLIVSSGWLSPLAAMVRGTGWTIEYVAWTIGLGAALLAWLRPRGFDPRSVPPVVPPIPRTSATAV